MGDRSNKTTQNCSVEGAVGQSYTWRWNCWREKRETVLQLLHLRLMFLMELSHSDQETKVRVGWPLTNQAALLFAFRGHHHAIYVHTPALATSLTPWWPALHQQNTRKSNGSGRYTDTNAKGYNCNLALRTYLLLSEETSLVTVGHVDIMLSIK